MPDARTTPPSYADIAYGGAGRDILIADDEESPIYELELFWIDVEWKTAGDSGRFMFELQRPAPLTE